MSRILISTLALFANVVALAGSPDTAFAQKRVAFVVGTDKYDNLDRTRQLQRAVNDARAVAAAFKSLGFEVIAGENLSRAEFNREWQKFLDILQARDTAAIYYAGHGVEIEGLNFLLPRDIPDIKFGRQEQIKRESLSVAEVLLDLRTRNPDVAVVILDACRDNPLVPDELRSAGTRGAGLAPLRGEPPKGTFVMYSAGAGESALDRLPGNDPDKVNSIFTRKLIPLMAKKGLPIHELARQLRTDVLSLASSVPHQQRPAYYDGIDSTFCLAGCDAGSGAAALTLQIMQQAGEAWTSIRNSTDAAALEAFIARYKDTAFAELAKVRLEDVRKHVAAAKNVLAAKAASEKSEADAAQARKAEDLIRARKDAERQQFAMQVEEQRRQLEAKKEKESVAPASAFKPGSVFHDCSECPEMVVLPAGEFMMGSPESETGRDVREGLPRKVTIAKPFAVGRFEVTFAEWDACVAGGGCTKREDNGWGRGRRPVINVSWDDAGQYTTWLSRRIDKSYRLLTEAEWEYSARAGTITPFTTGATISADQANYDGNATLQGVHWQKTVDVGSFPANAFGLHDLHGNVGEWVADCYKDRQAAGPERDTRPMHVVPVADRPTGNLRIAKPEACAFRVLRGGSWSDGPALLRSAARFMLGPASRVPNAGFRVARSLSQ